MKKTNSTPESTAPVTRSASITEAEIERLDVTIDAIANINSLIGDGTTGEMVSRQAVFELLVPHVSALYEFSSQISERIESEGAE